jgi:hypothetical protein
MTNDADWIEDVRRWCCAGARSIADAQRPSCGEGTDLMALGYEAAHPTLQAQHWPDAPVTAFGDAR